MNAEAVSTWLRAQGIVVEGEPAVTQYSGGASNWTYRLEYANRDLVLRMPPAGTKAKTAHDVAREYRIQSAIASVFPAVPSMVALCEDTSVIGAPFYVMERVEGIIMRRHVPRGMTIDATQARALCHAMLDKLVELHRIDVAAAGLTALAKGSGYVERQVKGWTERYAKAHTWNVPRWKRVTDWLDEHRPADTRICLVHGDWRFDNCVLDPADPTRIKAVLDWELATLGDPWMELGNLLAYWVEASDNRIMKMSARQPTMIPGMLTRREVVAYYSAKTGESVSNWTFYEVFGLFRLAAIAQQVYYRYHHHEVRNPAFKHFWLAVHALHWRALGLIRRANT
jgi:aminoglycoside phosphotransferase (APT) family kinase protein